MKKTAIIAIVLGVISFGVLCGIFLFRNKKPECHFHQSLGRDEFREFRL